MNKVKVVGVRFRSAGKVYFFSPGEYDIKMTDHVIVETARGVEYGTVVGGIREVDEDKIVQPLKDVLRIATPKDDEQQVANLEKEKEALRLCKEKIAHHNLVMKLIDAEYTFDNNKLLFYFTADGRVDFRELVKDLASVFKTRIELRQIGVRDETKMLGGIGICGRILCCHTHLPEFAPVSIKMAKEQGLSLNPTKISGMCGRLMCCLKNEEDTYEYLNRRLPGVGDFVTTPDGSKGEVHSVNVLRQLVKVLIDVGDEKEMKEFSVDDLRFKKRHHSEISYSEEELKELKELEKLEKQDKEDNQESQNNRDNKRNGDNRKYNDNKNKENTKNNNTDNYVRNKHNEDGQGQNQKKNFKNNKHGKNHRNVDGDNANGVKDGDSVKDKREGGRPSEKQPENNTES